MRRDHYLVLLAAIVLGCAPGRDPGGGGSPPEAEPDVDAAPPGFADGGLPRDAARRVDAHCPSPCGPEASCCAEDALCLDGECTVPGDPCRDEIDCPEGHTCDAVLERCLPLSPEGACRYLPPEGTFDPELQWAWSGGDVLVTPVVVSLGGDDVPDVVVVSHEGDDRDTGRLVALSGDDGRVLWRSPDGVPLRATVHPAAGDLDGDGDVEIVAAGAGEAGCIEARCQEVVAFAHDGTVAWRSTVRVAADAVAVSVADLEGDGRAEVVVAGSVLEHDGSLRWRRDDLGVAGVFGGTNVPVVADLDGDGEKEIATTSVAYRAGGEVFWRGGSIDAGEVALGHLLDLSGSPGPQLVAVDGSRYEILDATTGESLLGPVQYEETRTDILGRPIPHGHAGPPTVADFDGDGRPEVGVAGYARYVVIDPDRSTADRVSWAVDSEDQSTGSVGSTVFDFDGDGEAEVVYADECHLRILRGRDGALLWYVANTSATWFENPVVADVDGDGNAEVVVVGNDESPDCGGRSLPAGGTTRGVRVYRDRLDNWVPTRRVWNQHGYRVDNVREDGSIPAVERPSWSTHNTYRLNRLDPEAASRAPNLGIAELDAEPDASPVRLTLRALVRNDGSLGVPAGLEVAFYAGAPDAPGRLLAVAATRGPLPAGATEWVEAVAEDVPADMGVLRFHAVADDGGDGTGAHNECIEDDNAGAALDVECRGPI